MTPLQHAADAAFSAADFEAAEAAVVAAVVAAEARHHAALETAAKLDFEYFCDTATDSTGGNLCL